jgi:glutamine amidotransferase
MIIIVNYGMGNLGSIANMLKKAGHRAIISGDLDEIERAKKLIIPGVGAFDNGMINLSQLNLIEILNRKVMEEKVPTLGLCLGLQLFSTKSEEGNLPGLGWMDMETAHFNFPENNSHLKIPHMGWNTIEIMYGQHPLLEGLDHESRFYFVHSFHLKTSNPALVLAQTEYGYSFPSILGKDNLMGVQFHPEKSHRFGMQLLKNFAERF